MDTDEIFILELLIDAGFISQQGPFAFQAKKSFGAFRAGDIGRLKSATIEKTAEVLTCPPQKQKAD